MAKEITIISGKGGTGKTLITSSFADIVQNKVMVDCDVDAANLYLIVVPMQKKSYSFEAGYLAEINFKHCNHCRLCIEKCPFDAISDKYEINELECEGCGVCAYLCPQQCIELKDRTAGDWYISDTEYGILVHARLEPGQSNSGKLVSLIREEAKKIAAKMNVDYIINDGPPGIGCPTMSSITKADMALIVAEPTQSGIHDLDRTISLTQKFDIKIGVCINKSTINVELTTEISNLCAKRGVSLLGKIPYNKVVLDAMRNCQPVTKVEQGEVSNAIRQIWDNCKELLETK